MGEKISQLLFPPVGDTVKDDDLVAIVTERLEGSVLTLRTRKVRRADFVLGYTPHADMFSDFVVSGLLSPTSANLSSTRSTGSAYVTGLRVVKAAEAFTYAASSDTYEDMAATGVITRIAVANGAAAPAVTANTLRLQKVVTNATAVTVVTRLAATRSTGDFSTLTATGNITASGPNGIVSDHPFSSRHSWNLAGVEKAVMLSEGDNLKGFTQQFLFYNYAGSVLYASLDGNGMAVTGNLSATGALKIYNTSFASIDAEGGIVSRGIRAQFNFADRTPGQPPWAWYALDGVARLYNDNTGDILSVTAAGLLTTKAITAAGDITTFRPGAPTTGVIYLSNLGTKYLFYDGNNYVMPGGQLFVNGSQVATGTSGKAFDSELLDGVDGSRHWWGDNSTLTRHKGGQDMNAPQPSGFYEYVNSANTPVANWAWTINFRHSNESTPGGHYGYQLANVIGGNDLYIRGVDAGVWRPWNKFWHDGNFSSAWTLATLLNGWVNYNGGFHGAAYRKEGGRVHLRGLVGSGTITAGTALFTLPAGFRPASNEIFAQHHAAGHCRVDVQSTGNVTIQGVTSNEFLSISGISFAVDA